MAIKAVIFDYKTLLLSPGSSHAESAAAMLDWLQNRGISWCAFSTDSFETYRKEFDRLNYPDPALKVDQGSIPSEKKRGSPDWVDVVTTKLKLKRHELLYVGSTTLDWRTAINSGVLYLHARWVNPVPAGTTSYAVTSPSDAVDFIRIFLAGEAFWHSRIDQDNWALRSLLPASAVMPATLPKQQFKLQDVFTYDRSITVGTSDARDVLMLFVLANAYLEGLVPSNPLICVYPSSSVGKVSKQLEDYLDKAAALFHGYYKEDLLVRTSNAKDTSLERWHGRKVSIVDQASTVRLGPKYRGKLTNKTVLVFDDFTTKGMSLEWARLLLKEAGAARIVMLTLGKYGGSHNRYEISSEARFDPFSGNGLEQDDFRENPIRLTVDPQVEAHLTKLLNEFIALPPN